MPAQPQLYTEPHDETTYSEIEEIENNINRCQFSILEDSIRIGQYLHRARGLLDYGEYLSWVEKFMPFQRADECLWLSDAYSDSDTNLYHLLHDANIKSKSKALLFRRLPENLIADCLMVGHLGDVPLGEVGDLSVRDIAKKIRELIIPTPTTPLPTQTEIHFNEHIHRPLVDGVSALQEAQDRIAEWVLLSDGDDLTRKQERNSLVTLLDEIDGFVYRTRNVLMGGTHG
ncbi:MAG: DUF3102 domain-containing protein [Gemmatimonadetes bacterium]|nr:DUF3102 domain-containing protein [Gemmatimonadota bacterium]